MGDVTSGDLVRAALAGSEPAWEELVDRFAPLVWSIARAHRLDRASAKDVSQEVWSRLAQRVGTIREPDRIAGWLATTARNEAIRALNKADRERPDDRIADALPPSADPAAVDLIRRDDAHTVVAAFTRLDGRCQLLLRLLLVEPRLSYDEISEALEMPIGSIGPTRARCLDKLRRELEAEGFQR